MSPRRLLPVGTSAALALLATGLAAVPAAAAQVPGHAAKQRHHARARRASAEDARLAAAVNSYSAALGVRRDSTAAIARAALPPAVAGALADELGQLYRCDLITQSSLPAVLKLFPGGTGLPLGVPAVFPYRVQTAGQTVLGVPVPPAPNPPVYQNFPFQAQVQACGDATVAKLDALRAALTSRGVPSSSALDLWPVLSFQPGGGGHHTYTHDYVLLVDAGSHNTFLNNAGGSGIDIWRGPAGSGAPIVAPARGCIDAFDIIRKQTCTLASAALLELGSGNTYGRLQAPDPATDGACTASPVEPRVFVQGTGVAGVGVLIDEGSNNTYIGKVLTDGTGHIGGYGYLRDDGSGNSYTAIRDAFGDAVVGGIGTFIANGSGNSYTYYDPAPSVPGAAPGTLGSGGVVDDLNNCDAGTAIMLGAGAVGGVGSFEAHGSNNSYNAPIDSLGSGTVAGKGTFTATGGGGTNAYTGPGAAGRGNGVTVTPTATDNGTFSDS